MVDNPSEVAKDQKLSVRIQSARERFQAALKQSSGTREQALGLLLQSAGLPSAQHSEDSESLDALAQMAAISSDPVVYEIALLRCHKRQASGMAVSCESLSTRRWAEIDPDNAVPWLALASEASQLHDAVNEAIDLHQAAVAQRFDNYSTSLLAMAQPAIPKDLTPFEQYYLRKL